jgi:hypothetical protein
MSSPDVKQPATRNPSLLELPEYGTYAIDLHTDSLAVFKSCLLNYYFTSVDITYDPENPQTFRSLCLKCNCVRSLVSPISCCY